MDYEHKSQYSKYKRYAASQHQLKSMTRLCRVNHFHILGVRLPFSDVVLTSVRVIVQDDSVPKGSRNLLQRLFLGFSGYRYC